MIELKCWHSLEGFRHVLVKPGRKYLHLLVMDGGLHVRQVPREEERFLAEPLGKARAWTTVCRHFAGHGKRHGSTKAARKFLAEARKQ
jgi:hypothetical protein